MTFENRSLDFVPSSSQLSYYGFGKGTRTQDPKQRGEVSLRRFIVWKCGNRGGGARVLLAETESRGVVVDCRVRPGWEDR